MTWRAYVTGIVFDHKARSCMHSTAKGRDAAVLWSLPSLRHAHTPADPTHSKVPCRLAHWQTLQTLRATLQRLVGHRADGATAASLAASETPWARWMQAVDTWLTRPLVRGVWMGQQQQQQQQQQLEWFCTVALPRVAACSPSSCTIPVLWRVVSCIAVLEQAAAEAGSAAIPVWTQRAVAFALRDCCAPSTSSSSSLSSVSPGLFALPACVERQVRAAQGVSLLLEQEDQQPQFDTDTRVSAWACLFEALCGQVTTPPWVSPAVALLLVRCIQWLLYLRAALGCGATEQLCVPPWPAAVQRRLCAGYALLVTAARNEISPDSARSRLFRRLLADATVLLPSGGEEDSSPSPDMASDAASAPLHAATVDDLFDHISDPVLPVGSPASPGSRQVLTPTRKRKRAGTREELLSFGHAHFSDAEFFPSPRPKRMRHELEPTKPEEKQPDSRVRIAHRHDWSIHRIWAEISDANILFLLPITVMATMTRLTPRRVDPDLVRGVFSKADYPPALKRATIGRFLHDNLGDLSNLLSSHSSDGVELREALLSVMTSWLSILSNDAICNAFSMLESSISTQAARLTAGNRLCLIRVILLSFWGDQPPTRSLLGLSIQPTASNTYLSPAPAFARIFSDLDTWDHPQRQFSVPGGTALELHPAVIVDALDGEEGEEVSDSEDSISAALRTDRVHSLLSPVARSGDSLGFGDLEDFITWST